MPSSPARVAGAEGTAEGGNLVRRVRDPEQVVERGRRSESQLLMRKWGARAWRTIRLP